MDTIGTLIGAVSLLAFAIAVILGYFLPALIGARRNVNNANTLAMVNLFLGWTALLWVVCLIWAVMGQTEDEDDYYRRKREALKRISP